ncbi:MAG TPA: deoxyribodipyrimidine photo-lyase, partial [Chitinophagales bacterium]|nr:deoxyribodipyrimidine photo-lyase [Chitinophagales bacterium]
MKSSVSIFWFRRDLRLEDNVGLCQALTSGYPILPIFIFDETILSHIENKKDRRVDYIHQALSKINVELKTHQSTLFTFYGKPLDIFKILLEKYDIQGVFCNRDYEPKAIKRDTEIYQFFKTQNIPFKAFKDQVIFDKNEILKNDGTPYTVYTPYSQKWKEKLTVENYQTYKADFTSFFKINFSEIHSLQEIGFQKTEFEFIEPTLNPDIIDEYDKFRDYPATQRTTQLGIALRFGTISVRQCVAFALEHNQTWLNELIWREFFMQ